ncbi:MLX-interacting protein-like [Paramacrobiotus metropolitanus]|uniref:MLX-interacting protein-like n=1 Tax=Paramacrobiotus metropolitanus TaxID=2943436 RepID=UPI0024456422|nr:MLX-interacting protein-like [Paramacrobiotus metropolitanus]
MTSTMSRSAAPVSSLRRLDERASPGNSRLASALSGSRSPSAGRGPALLGATGVGHAPGGKEIIHSGHFMMSNVPQDEDDDDESDEVTTGSEELLSDAPEDPRPAPKAPPQTAPVAAQAGPSRPAYRAQQAHLPRGRSNSMTHDGMHRSRMNIAPQQQKGKLIDSSLSKLFECMTLAYRAKLTSPKWNNFKGLKLRWTIKIRLNNVIWRAWHMQFIKQVRPLIAPFSIEVDNSVHNKTESVLVEGKYWKRRQSIVSSEYRRWRLWYKDRISGVRTRTDSMGASAMSYDPHNEGMLQQPCLEEPMMLDDVLLPDFTDALLARLGQQPFAFPDPREIAQAGYADFIQPGLLPLQPSLEDLMDTLEPLNEYFAQQNQASSGYNPVGQFGMGSSQEFISQDNYGGSDAYWKQSLALPDYLVQSVSPPAPHQPSSNPSRAPPAAGTSSAYMSDYASPQYAPPTTYSTQYSGGTLDAMQPLDTFRAGPQHPQSGLSEFELRREDIRQRSLSGPTPGGGPLIQPDVLAALASFGRSISASSGNVAQAGYAPTDAQSGSASAPVSRLNSIVPNSNAFVVPEVHPISKGRGRGKKAAAESASTAGVPSAQFNAPGRTALSVTLPSSNEGSTLARLLTSGPVFPGGVIQPASGSPSRKKLAPKPAANEPKIRPAPPTLTSVVLPAEIVSEPLVVPKVENTFLQDSGLFRRRMEESVGERPRSRESRRMNHITAEQKRRGDIKSGFEILQGMVPQLAASASHSPGKQVSKAVILQRGAEHIHRLKEERRQMQAEADALKQQIEAINHAVTVCQQQLPATGAPVSSRARKDRMNEMLDEHIRAQTMHNWKYWLFSLTMRPLVDSYASSVACRGVEELGQNVLNWVDQQCTLTQLRPLIKESMRKVSTSTHILSDPGRLPEEARQAVQPKPAAKAYASPSTSSSTSSLGNSTTLGSPNNTRGSPHPGTHFS